MKNKTRKPIPTTPGDWELLRWGKEIKGHPIDAGHVIQAHDGIIGVEIARIPVCSETSESVPCKTIGGRDRTINKRIVTCKESLANAKLMALAPELLRCLIATWIIIEGDKALLHHVGHCTNRANGKTLHENVREAIANATT